MTFGCQAHNPALNFMSAYKQITSRRIRWTPCNEMWQHISLCSLQSCSLCTAWDLVVWYLTKRDKKKTNKQTNKKKWVQLHPSPMFQCTCIHHDKCLCTYFRMCYPPVAICQNSVRVYLIPLHWKFFIWWVANGFPLQRWKIIIWVVT